MDAERPAASPPLLRIRDVTVRFGGVVALDKVSFDVEAGQICGLIGPNGAGKSTLFNCLSRLYDCDEGSIEVGGLSTLSKARHEIAHLGIGRTFQNLALFKTMTARENVLLGVHGKVQPRFLASASRLRSQRALEAEHQAHARELIDSLGLTSVAERNVAELPFGTQKRVELGRALIARPRLLLLDEPACGLNHEEVKELGAFLKDLQRRFGLAHATRQREHDHDAGEHPELPCIARVSIAAAPVLREAPQLRPAPSLRWAPTSRSPRSASAVPHCRARHLAVMERYPTKPLSPFSIGPSSSA